MAEFTPMILNFAIGAAKAKSANKAASVQNEYENSRIRRSQEIEAKKQKEDLKRAQATRRANFGARGINAAGGSAAAVLSGMTKKMDDELAVDGRDAAYQISLNNNALKNRQKRNLLELSSPFERMAHGMLKSRLPGKNLLD